MAFVASTPAVSRWSAAAPFRPPVPHTARRSLAVRPALTSSPRLGRRFIAGPRLGSRGFLVLASSSREDGDSKRSESTSSETPPPTTDYALSDLVTQRKQISPDDKSADGNREAAQSEAVPPARMGESSPKPETTAASTAETRPDEERKDDARPAEPSAVADTATPPPSPAFASATLPASTPATDVMPAEDLAALKSIFSFDSFFMTESMPYRNGAIFKGNMRNKDPEEVLATLNKRLRDNKKLSEPYNLFLLENYEDDRPVIVASPVRNDPPVTSTTQKWLTAALLVGSAFTCAEVGAAVIGSDIFTSDEWINGWPVAAGVFNLQVISYLSRLATARKYGVTLSPPFVVPSEQLGTFGAIANLDSNPPTRKALLDIALVPSVVAGSLSLVALILGFALGPSASGAPEVASEFFFGSALIGGLAKLFLPASALAPGAQVAIHPLLAIGWAGLTVSALNLLPVGRLDGGRLIQAVYGRKMAARISGAVLFLLGLAALFSNNAVILYFSIFVFFLQRDPERPSLNEISAPDDARIYAALAALFVALTVLSPLPTPTTADANFFASLM